MKTAASNGVIIFGWLLILGSLYQIAALASGGYEHYAYLFGQYSPKIILIRFWVSWATKIVGLIAGIGLLKLNDWCRKLAILNSVFVVLLVNLKHPFAAYSLHAKELDQMLGKILPVSFSSLVWPALILQRAIDVVFGVLLIYYFTRPQVRKQFNRA